MIANYLNPSYDNRVNDLLNGLEKILKSLTEMRNSASDSHGLGNTRITIEKRHARLLNALADKGQAKVIGKTKGAKWYLTSNN